MPRRTLADPRADLSASELEVLKAMWEIGPCTVRQVMNHLHENGREVAYTTVLTFLTRLEQKGYARSDKTGVAYRYRPLVTRDRVIKSRLQSLIKTLYDGAAGPLVLQLVREEQLQPEEIRQLQNLIDQFDDAADANRDNGRRKSR